MVQMLMFTGVPAVLASLLLGWAFIPLFIKMKFGQSIREEGPEAHLSKSGTPTMGGLIFIIATLGIILFHFDFGPETRLFLILMLGLGFVGFADDFLKIQRKQNLGLHAWQKLAGQMMVAVFAAWFAAENFGTGILIPGLDGSFDLGILYYPFTVFVILSLANGVNLTDGLDGLAASVTLLIMLTLAMISYRLGAFENATIAVALAGGLIGFLFFNRYPAKVFMGDVGSLALGGAVVSLTLSTGTVLWILIFGIIYVIETLSVVLQVTSFKLTKKRLFKMSPIHHHFELSGWHEKKIVAVFSIITLLGCLLSLVLL
jgi:phospho-N-acetylmuramoyl-pentapeptide-transferase